MLCILVLISIASVNAVDMNNSIQSKEFDNNKNIIDENEYIGEINNFNDNSLIKSNNNKNVLSNNSLKNNLLESSNNNLLSGDNPEIIKSDNSENQILAADGTTLNNEVKNGGHIILKYKLYSLNGARINLVSNTFIDGNGTIIDGQSKNSGFNINNVHNVILNNITFINCFNNNEKARGTCIVITGTNTYDINVTNCYFNNIKSGWGSAVYVHHDSQSVHGVNIINCTVNKSYTVNAGAFNIAHYAVSGHDIYYRAPYNNHIINCTLIDCSSNNNGGGIEFMSKDSSIEKCTFINCIASGEFNQEGGGIVLYSNALNNLIDQCTFINCKAEKAGGAISSKNESNKNVTITNCIFIGCNSPKGGGVYFNGDPSYMNNCSFINCRADNGGALYFNAAHSHVTNCTFDNNSAITGGAICFNGKACTLTDCNITNNIATGHGGGLYFAATDSYILRCAFINNTSLGDGGGMCSQAPKGSISYVEASTFIGNKAPTGMDFYSHPGSQIKFIGLKFNVLWLTNDNEMDGSVEASVLNGYGTWYNKPARWDNDAMEFLNTENGKITIYLVGDITSLDEKILNIPNLEIIGYDKDTNPIGASVDLSGWNHRAFTVAATNVMFKNIMFKNSNLISGDGGVIKISSSRVSQIRNCTFINNTATYGGAVSFNNTVHNGIFIVNDSTFKANKALIHGGALYFGNSSDFTNILDTVIQDNRIITDPSENAAAYYQSRMDIINTPLYYFLDPFSIEHERNNSEGNNPIITNHGILCREEVYVSLSYALNPEQKKGNGTAYNDTTDFISGIALVKATGGTIHFLPNEVYTLEDIKRLEPGFNWYVEFFKFNIFLEGNNCTFSNFGTTMISIL